MNPAGTRIVSGKSEHGYPTSAREKRAADGPLREARNTVTRRVRAAENKGVQFKEGRSLSSAISAETDAAGGIGHFISRLQAARLPRNISTPLEVMRAGAARALGGLIGAGVGAYRIVQAAKSDIAAGDRSFSNTRRETVVTLGSITAGFAAGEAGYLLTGGAAAVGAPAAVTTILGGATVLGAGYAVYQARNHLETWCDEE